MLAFECDRPTAGSARYNLSALNTVQIGRGDARRTVRSKDTLRVDVPDRQISTEHAEIHLEFGRFIIEDTRSKNGVRINGQKLSRALLEDGDRIELGHTILIFRNVMVETVEDRTLNGDELPIGLTTLSPVLENEFVRLEQIARSDTPVIVHGESGTGKELIAQALHLLSGRTGTLVAVNCGALPNTLVESELFGHRRGAFSGAIEDRPGLIRSADGGTLFLDEIGDLSASAQVALLRALQEKEVLSVGATRPVKVDLRVVSASHRDLPAMVASGEFRNDLLARLSGYTLDLPPLADRREDLGLFISTLLRRIVGGSAEKVHFTPEAAGAIFDYDWPQNIRQLEQCLTAAVALAGSSEIALDHLPSEMRDPGATNVTDAGPSDDAERDRLIALLREHRGNVSAVARARGKARMQIQRWLKRYQLDPRSFHGQ